MFLPKSTKPFFGTLTPYILKCLFLSKDIKIIIFVLGLDELLNKTKTEDILVTKKF
jgi:hypothetical protein